MSEVVWRGKKAQAVRKPGSSKAAAQCCQAGQVFMDLPAPTEMGWPAPKIKNDSSGLFAGSRDVT